MTADSLIGSVALVGAGPGDPGLITLRGMELLQNCDALVYDNLMADEFIALGGRAERFFVGKSSGKHAMPQEEINALLVKLGKAGKRVVRLKGGDPFVFGRGGEEALALKEAGIPYTVVPSVTAGIAGTAYAGIPVTHREISRGVTLVTGHFAKDRRVELPWKALAGLGHTLVFYMGISATPTITKELMAAGLSPETPAAIVERATTGSQKELVADVSSIGERAIAAGVKPPGLLVIGDVVNLQEKLAWCPDRPLAGKGIIFTRASESQYSAIERLRSLGAQVLDVPVVRAVAREADPDVYETIDELDSFDAIAFTSALAVDIFFGAMRRKGLDVRRLATHAIAAGSPTVINALQQRGVVPDIARGKYRRVGLSDMLEKTLPKGARVLLPRSSAADTALPDSLKAAGLLPVPVSVYDTKPVDLNWLSVKLANWRPDAVTFLSGSTIKSLLDAVPQLLEGDQPIWACVGAKSAASLIERGLKADIIPDTPDVDEMVEALIAKLS